jgi:hypothetical protein
MFRPALPSSPTAARAKAARLNHSSISSLSGRSWLRLGSPTRLGRSVVVTLSRFLSMLSVMFKGAPLRQMKMLETVQPSRTVCRNRFASRSK